MMEVCRQYGASQQTSALPSSPYDTPTPPGVGCVLGKAWFTETRTNNATTSDVPSLDELRRMVAEIEAARPKCDFFLFTAKQWYDIEPKLSVKIDRQWASYEVVGIAGIPCRIAHTPDEYWAIIRDARDRGQRVGVIQQDDKGDTP